MASTSLTLPGLEEKTYTVSIFSLTGANHFTGNDTRDKHGQVHTLVIIFLFQHMATLSSSLLLSSHFYCLSALSMMSKREDMGEILKLTPIHSNKDVAQ